MISRDLAQAEIMRSNLLPRKGHVSSFVEYLSGVNRPCVETCAHCVSGR